MMIAVGQGLIIEMNHVTRIQFDEGRVVAANGHNVTGATIYFVGPSMVKLSGEQAVILLQCLNAIGGATPQPAAPIIPFPNQVPT